MANLYNQTLAGEDYLYFVSCARQCQEVSLRKLLGGILRLGSMRVLAQNHMARVQDFEADATK
jgi:hypothetical protein